MQLKIKTPALRVFRDQKRFIPNPTKRSLAARCTSTRSSCSQDLAKQRQVILTGTRIIMADAAGSNTGMAINFSEQCVCVCVCVFVCVISFILDVPAGVTQEEGHTGFLYLRSAVLALIFLARRIQPFLSLVDREVESCVQNM